LIANYETLQALHWQYLQINLKMENAILIVLMIVVFYFFMGHLIISFLLAFANFFLVEKPLMNLETLLLRRQPRAKTQ